MSANAVRTALSDTFELLSTGGRRDKENFLQISVLIHNRAGYSFLSL